MMFILKDLAKGTAKRVLKAALPERAFNLMRLRVMRRRVARFQARTVEHIYGGHKLRVRIADPVGQDWYDRDWLALPEIDFLKAHGLREGARVLDVGAHQGVLALMLSRLVGPSGSVVAVEASPFNADLARQNSELNFAPNIKVINCAVAEHAGELYLNEDSNGQVDPEQELGQIRIEARTIDSIAKEHGVPQVVLVDIEGFECQALRGAHETLKTRPVTLIEVNVGTGLEKFGGSIAELASFFDAGYRFFVAGQREYRFVEASREQLIGGKFSAELPVLLERFFLAAIPS